MSLLPWTSDNILFKQPLGIFDVKVHTSIILFTHT